MCGASSKSPGLRGTRDRGLGGTRWPGLPAFSGDSARSLSPAPGRTDSVAACAAACPALTRHAICSPPLRFQTAWPESPPCSARLATAGRPSLGLSSHSPVGRFASLSRLLVWGFKFSSEIEFCSFLCASFTVFRSFQKEETRDIYSQVGTCSLKGADRSRPCFF